MTPVTDSSCQISYSQYVTETPTAIKNCESSPLSKILCSGGTTFTVCDWEPGSKIYSQHEIPDGAYLIESGAIGLKTKGQQRLFFSVLGLDGILGLPETLGRHPCPYEAVVLQPTRAIFISNSELNRLLRSDPAAAIQILNAMANQTNSLLKIAAELKAGRRGSRADRSQPRSKRG